MVPHSGARVGETLEYGPSGNWTRTPLRPIIIGWTGGTRMPESWIDRWSGGSSLERDDRARLESISTRGRTFEAGQVLVFEEDDAPLMFFVERGWAAAVRDLADGSMQILDLFLAGQIIGLREITSPDAISSYRALTDLDVRILRKSEMQKGRRGDLRLRAPTAARVACEKQYWPRLAKLIL